MALIAVLSLGMTPFDGVAAAAERTSWKFTIGGGPSADPQTVQLNDEETYDTIRGYGYERDDRPLPATRPAVASKNEPDTRVGPFAISVRVPEGNYRVMAKLVGADATPTVVIRSEARRLMTPPVSPDARETAVVEFTVNVRRPRIDDTSAVKLSPREQFASARQWDDKLTLDFVGARPTLSSLWIEKADDVTTVFLAGDSTVCDQAEEPWVGWGQMLPQFFDSRVAVANYAESGRTLRSFKAENRFAKILSVLKPGDWVFIQFGHNDMKEKGDGVGPFTTFVASLKQYVAAVRAKGGQPVLLTPMHRRKFDGDAVVPTFGDYPEAVRRVAAVDKVPLIDLQAMSRTLYEAVGPDKSKQMFVHFPAGTFPGQTVALKDDTHVRAFGGDQIARCVVQGIRDLKLPLADDLRAGVPGFDPSKPHDPDAYVLPTSAAGRPIAPEGR